MKTDDEYYTELEAYLHKEQKTLAPYQGDPAMDSMGATLSEPPFRPPTPQEILAELPAADCRCAHARYAVFVWYNPELQTANWYTTMITPVRPVPVVTHCPFCGDALPALIRKNLPEGYPRECYYSAAPQS